MSKSDILKCSREKLEQAVRGATSMIEVLEAIGLHGTGGNYRALSSRLHDLAISVDHFTRKRRSRYTRELLEPIAQRCSSIAGVIRELGLEPSGGTHRYIQALLQLRNFGRTLHRSSMGTRTISRGSCCARAWCPAQVPSRLRRFHRERAAYSWLSPDGTSSADGMGLPLHGVRHRRMERQAPEASRRPR